MLYLVNTKLTCLKTSFKYAVINYYPADSYPFGMLMPDRNGAVSGTDYRYGFNGQEQETEISNSNSHTSAEYWMYDSRLGRRWNLDPVSKPSRSDYATFENSPLTLPDPEGKCTTCPSGEAAKKVYANGAVVQDGGEGGKEFMHVDGRWIDISDLPSGYGNNSGYKYTVNDIILRDAIRSSGERNPLWRGIKSAEKRGYATQISFEPDKFHGDLAGDPWVDEVLYLTSTGVDVVFTLIGVLMFADAVSQPSHVSPGNRALGPQKVPKYARNEYKSLTPKKRKIVIEEEPICVYCKEKSSNTVDHIKSNKRDWTEGGFKDSRDVRSQRANRRENLTGACRTCNSKKGEKELGTEWTPPK